MIGIFNHDRIEELHPALGKSNAKSSFETHHSQKCSSRITTISAKFAKSASENRMESITREAHHIKYLSDGGPDVSGKYDCALPETQRRIIHETHAEFRKQDLTFI
ncbi:MAG: hypothetical protein R2848_01175 [Thermomicrobiales bacterium]